MTLKAPARPGLSLSPVSVRGRPLHRTERQCAALIQLVMTRLRTRVARCAQPPTGRDARLSTRETKHRVAIDLVRRQVVVVAELAMTWAAEVGSP
jgi:hypothetical protein